MTKTTQKQKKITLNSPELIYFQVAFQKQIELEKSIYVEGYASTNKVDYFNHVVDTQVRTDEVIGEFMKNPALLLQHKKRVGSIIDIERDERGIYIKAIIENDIDNCFQKIRLGHIAGFSVGFFVDDCVIEETGYVRPILRITKLRRYETSVVEVPANSDSLFTIQKSMTQFQNNMIRKMLESTDEITYTTDTTDETENTTETTETTEDTSENTTDNTTDNTTVTTDNTTDETTDETQDSGNNADEIDGEPAEAAQTDIQQLSQTIAKLQSMIEQLQKETNTKVEALQQKMVPVEELEKLQERLNNIPTHLAKSAAQGAELDQIMQKTKAPINTFYKAN